MAVAARRATADIIDAIPTHTFDAIEAAGPVALLRQAHSRSAVVAFDAIRVSLAGAADIGSVLNLRQFESAIVVGVHTGLNCLTTGAAVGTGGLCHDVDQGANGIARVARLGDLIGRENPVAVEVKPRLDAYTPGRAVRTCGFII
jgi:hypothetical protein